ncbi:hypothetical protein NF212_22615 [Parasalinivibrio latis]|uniref:hypothetical protein n=1 Tax=Parasalinivibrio latis TaxID=2952610 RepID=UPI0030E05CBE
MDNLFQSQHYQSRIPADTPAPLKSAARKAISMIVIQSCSLRYAVKVAAGKHQVQEQTLLKLVSLCIPPSFYSQRAFQARVAFEDRIREEQKITLSPQQRQAGLAQIQKLRDRFGLH